MYNNYRRFKCPYCSNTPAYYPENVNLDYDEFPYSCLNNSEAYNPEFICQFPNLNNYDSKPYIVNIEEATKQNNNFRTTLWTGNHLQVTLMNIGVGEDIGFEVHPNLDQFIRIEDGEGIVKMGDTKNNLNFQEKVYDDFAFIIPAGKWHNLINTGCKPLKLYSIYAPPQHEPGTVHETKAIAESYDNHYNYYA